jgi:hypothetical protein
MGSRMQPKPSTETCSPLFPSFRYFKGRILCKPSRSRRTGLVRG